MQQLSIFDITPNPDRGSLPIPVQPKPEPPPEVSAWFDYEIPCVADTSSILAIGDRVLILPQKYSQKANCPGVVKGFIGGEVLVKRRDGEGLYRRHELHRFKGEMKR